MTTNQAFQRIFSSDIEKAKCCDWVRLHAPKIIKSWGDNLPDNAVKYGVTHEANRLAIKQYAQNLAQ